MKKTFSVIIALIFFALSTGCASYDGTGESTQTSIESSGVENANGIGAEMPHKNLDLTNTAIIENTPTTGKWQKIIYDIPGLDDRSADRLAYIASNFGITVGKKDITLVQLTDDEDNEDGVEYVPYTDEAEALLSKYLEYKLDPSKDFTDFYYYMYYLGDIYMEIQDFTGGLIEYDNRKNVNSVLELDFTDNSPWRPNFFRKSQRSIDPDDETATCVLDGKTVKVADAVKNAEKYILENEILFPKSFGANVTDVTLFSYENGNQCLALDFEFTIDGVTLDGGTPSNAIHDEDGNVYKTYQVVVQCAMVTDNTIDWIWFPVIDGATEFTSEDCEIAVSLEEACEIVSQELSQEYTFNVDEIQLMYAAQREGDGIHSYIEPKWRFYITDIKSQEYSRLFVYVSAVDGEVQISQVF